MKNKLLIPILIVAILFSNALSVVALSDSEILDSVVQNFSIGTARSDGSIFISRENDGPNLPTEAGDVTITYSSSPEGVIGTHGFINYPYFSDRAKIVTINATLSLGDESRTKSIVVNLMPVVSDITIEDVQTFDDYYTLFNVHISSDSSISGSVIATLYDENDLMIASEIYPAEQIVNVTLASAEWEYIKVFWIDTQTLMPLSKPITYNYSSLKEKDYAYIVDFGLTAGLSSRAEIMMYTSYGEMITVKTASNFKFYKYDDEEDNVVYNPYLDTAEFVDLLERGMIVTYKLNSAGEVCKITAAASNNDVVDVDYTNVFISGGADFRKASDELIVYNDNRVSTVYITNDTVIMVVDLDCRENEKYYSIATLDNLVDDYEYWEVAVLDVNKYREASCVIVSFDSFELQTPDTPIALVKGCLPQIDDEGNICTAYVCLHEGKEKIYVVDFDETVELSIGDIIFPRFTLNGKLKYSGIVCTLANGDAQFNEYYYFPEDADCFIGDISDIRGSRIYFDDNNGACNVAGANVYLYDTSYSKVSSQFKILEDIGEIYSDDMDADGTNEIYNVNDNPADSAKIFIREFEGAVQDVIIYLYYGM